MRAGLCFSPSFVSESECGLCLLQAVMYEAERRLIFTSYLVPEIMRVANYLFTEQT